MKKNNIFIISILIFLVIVKPTFAFSDVEEHWAFTTIQKMQGYKIVNGYEDNTFKPDDNMTRAEFITIVNRMLGLQEESSKYIPDINRTDWYYSEIRKAVKVGIIEGDQSGFTYPEEKITREEAIVILNRAFKLKKTTAIPKGYDDLDEIASWAKLEVYSAINAGYMNGYDDNTIKPQNNITRAEALTLIYRIVPNILTTDVYTGLITGNALIYEDNIVLNNLTIDGNLIISNRALSTLKIKDVTVKKNLIIIDKNQECINKLNVNGNIYEFSYKEESLNKYKNNEYGITFAVPQSAKIKLLSDNKDIDYKTEDLIVLNIEENDEYYLKNINTLSDIVISKYDNLYKKLEEGKIDSNQYQLFVEKSDNYLLVIKRDNIVYSLKFYNIKSSNLVDNVIATLDFFETEKVIDTKILTYKNSKLSLKFSYKDKYVSVDDSYNTNIINEDKNFFKLFIQVNTITDMQNYSLGEIKVLLTSIVSKDGDIKETDSFKIMNNNAIKYKIESDGKIIYSLYVVIGNNLYNLIFTGDETGMLEIGEGLFNEIVETLEF